MGMIIEPGSRLFGLDAKLARDIIYYINAKFCPFGDSTFSLDSVTNAIRKSIPVKELYYYNHPLQKKLREEAKEREINIANTMILEGWIALTNNGSYELTDKALSLSRHKFIRRLTRKNALQKLSDFLFRVLDWNSTNPYVKVVDVWLYGSMLTNSADVGDIDLVCRYLDNPSSPTLPSEQEIINSIFQNIDYLHKVKSHIKNRSPYISIDAFHVSEINIINGGTLKLINNGVLTSEAKHLIGNTKPPQNTKKPQKEKKWFFLGVMHEPNEFQFGFNIFDAKTIFSYMLDSCFYCGDIVFTHYEIRFAVENYIDIKNKKNGIRYWTNESTKECNELIPMVTDELICDGFIAICGSKELSHPCYKLTKKGIDFWLLTLAEPTPISKALKTLGIFLDRVATWNSEDHYMKIKDAWIYGAITTNPEFVGDVEIICDFEKNPASAEYTIGGFEEQSKVNNIYYRNTIPGKTIARHYRKLNKDALKFLTLRIPCISLRKYDPDFMKLIQDRCRCIQVVKDNKVIYSTPK